MPGALDRQLREALEGRAVIVGIGNRLRGDDALGPALIDRLRDRVSAPLVDCAEVPERYLGAIAERSPDSVLLVDAVDLGAVPGSVAVLDEEELPHRFSTTHDAPLRMLMQYLATETGAQVRLLAVQPAHLAFETPLSAPVETTLDALARIIAVILDDARRRAEAGSRLTSPASPGMTDSMNGGYLN
jgi:hydrogenase 3 maturation protease